MKTFGIIMDPIDSINPKKDSTFALISALQNKCIIEYIYPETLSFLDGKISGKSSKVRVFKNRKVFYELGYKREIDLNNLDAVLFRTDPPVNEKYMQLTYILDQIEKRGTLVINSPQSIRDMNEKILGLELSSKRVSTIITSNINKLKIFIKVNKKVVLKPLNLMGGKDIRLISSKDKIIENILLALTNNERKLILAQKYLPDIKKGDTRIIIYNGKVFPKGLVRYPPKNDFRANLSFGGKFKISNISKKYISHLENVAEFLRINRIYFAGVDMIGDIITEINITSPTGIQEIDKNVKNMLSKYIANEFITIVNSYYSNEVK